MTTASDLVLALDGLTKSFGANPVLRGVSLGVRAGEVRALLGENGAGKSTLVRIMLGLERVDAGTMTLAGEAYAPRSAAAARARGVVIVPQERTLSPHLTVQENIVLGIEPSRFGLLDGGAARAIATRAMQLVAPEVSQDLDRPAATLSVAAAQLVEIARALAQAGTGADGATRARVLVLDEPTSSLGQHDAERLFRVVADLKAKGLAVILVTHFLGDVRAHADRFTVLRDGRVAQEGDPRTTEPAAIVHAMLGRELDALGASPDDAGVDAADETTAAAGDLLREVRDVAGESRPSRASFVLRRGEILGIAGLVGSGRTELLRMIAGLDRPRAGSITRNAPRGIGLLSEDRGGEGLMLARSIADNVTLSPRAPWFALPVRVRAEGARFIERLGIRATGPEQPAGELSGGNQQKVQIARLLREDFDVLLVDEPTRGIDVAAKAQVLALLRELRAQGKGIVLVSSQLDELVSTCDRVAVLSRGELAPSRPARARSEADLLVEAAS